MRTNVSRMKRLTVQLESAHHLSGGRVPSRNEVRARRAHHSSERRRRRCLWAQVVFLEMLASKTSRLAAVLEGSVGREKHSQLR